MASTRQVRRFGAFVSGLLLYLTAIRVSCWLSGSSLPDQAYAALGGRYGSPAVAVESLLIALLVFGLALGWGRITAAPLMPGQRPVTHWCLAGIATAWLGAALYGTIYLSLSWYLHDLPIGLWLLAAGTPPLWGVLNTLAVVGGIVLTRRQMVPRTNQYAAPRPDLVS